MTFPVLIHTIKLQIKDTSQERAINPNLWKNPYIADAWQAREYKQSSWNVNRPPPPKKNPKTNYDEEKDKRRGGQVTEDGMTSFFPVPKTLSDKKGPQKKLDFWDFSYLSGF